MAHTDEPKASLRTTNPLWVVSLFISVSEATTGVVTVKSTTWIQTMFAIFSVIFPCVVLAVFFLVLWKKPYVWYAPKDFSDNVDVDVFVRAMRQNVRRGVEVAQTAAAASAAEAVSDLHLTVDAAEKVVQQAKDKAQEGVALSVASVDLSHFLGAGSTMQFIVSDSSTVSELLDAIYASISGHVPPYTYGLSWLIKIKGSGRLLVDIGTNWALNNRSGNSDTRALHEVGIAGGTCIEVVRPSAMP
ncbi:MAG TPA: hypothetical protein VGG05_23165 [Pseudonocardiaceae bacterium]|jgi:hypothetical protein